MTRLSLGIEMSGNVCSGMEGAHQNYLRYYYAPYGPQRLEARDIMLDDIPGSPAEIIETADKHLTDNHPAYPLKGLLPAAACVLRLCLDHEHPQIEVRDRVIAVPPGRAMYTAGAIKSHISDEKIMEGIGAETIIEGWNPTIAGPYGDAAWGTVFHLPAPDVSTARKSHQAILADRGGASQPVLFGLLGGEVLLELPTQPKRRAELSLIRG